MDDQLTHLSENCFGGKVLHRAVRRGGEEIPRAVFLGYARGSNGDQSRESTGVRLDENANGNVT